MKLDISKYLKNYIRDKFQVYCDNLDQKEFVSLINTIALDTSFKSYSVDQVLKGEVDTIIDDLVDKYTEIRLVYLKNYIKDKFQLYCRNLGQEEFMSFVNAIVLDASFKSYDINRVLKGDTDSVIDDLVDKYAKVKLTNVWANFRTLCDYVKSVIVSRSKDMGGISDLLLENISRDIALSCATSTNSIDYSSFMNGSFDDIFLNNFETQCNVIWNSCFEHAKRTVENANIAIGVDNSSFDNLITSVISSMLSKYDINDIIKGMYDDQILKRFNFYYKKMSEAVQKHVTNVLYDMLNLVDIDEKKVISEMTKKAMETGEISALEIISGKKDRYIENFANSHKIVVVKPEVKSTDPVMYIYDFISKNNSTNLSDDELEKMANKINIDLNDKYRYTPNDILLGKHDNFIRILFNQYVMKRSSVKNDTTPEKIKHNTKKRRIQRSGCALMLLGVLAGSALVGGIGYTIVDHLSDQIEYNSAISYVSDTIDDYSYSPIFTIHNDEFKPTGDNVIDFYLDVRHLDDDNFNYLGFYRAYDYVRDNRLAVMDNMLKYVKTKVNDDTNLRGLNVSNSSYLSFVCDRLEDMGCEKITKDKYRSVVEAYEDIMRSQMDDIPYDYLDSEQKEIVNEIMELYREYSEECMIELAESLKEEKIVTLDKQDFAGLGSGRRM